MSARKHRPSTIYLTATPVTDSDGWYWDAFTDRQYAMEAIRQLREEDARIGDGKRSMLYQLSTYGMKSVTVKEVRA